MANTDSFTADMTQPDDQHYSKVAVLLHWTISSCFLCALALGIASGYIPKADKNTLMFFHKSFGLTVLFLMVLRVLWRFTHKPPAFPQSMPLWMKKVAKISHFCLYIVALLMPISGLIMSSAHQFASSFWGLFTIQLPIKNPDIGDFAFNIHYYTAWLVGGLLFLHIGAVIKHQFIDKDNILSRMLFK